MTFSVCHSATTTFPTDNAAAPHFFQNISIQICTRIHTFPHKAVLRVYWVRYSKADGRPSLLSCRGTFLLFHNNKQNAQLMCELLQQRGWAADGAADRQRAPAQTLTEKVINPTHGRSASVYIKWKADKIRENKRLSRVNNENRCNNRAQE